MTTYAPANQMPTPSNPRRGLLAKVGVPLLERLTTPHSPDRYLEMLNPTWSLREVRATVTAVRHSAPGSITFWFDRTAIGVAFRLASTSCSPCSSLGSGAAAATR